MPPTTESEAEWAMKKRMIKLTNNQPFPYDAASYDQCRWTYPSIITNYKDKAHIPSQELVYAGIKKTLTKIKKETPCVRCAMKIGENNATGVLFPLDKGIYLIPIPCCEQCFGRVPTVLVNGQICPLRHYTWKMIVCANLAEHYHKKVMEEATKSIPVEKEPMIVYQQEEPIIKVDDQVPVEWDQPNLWEIPSYEMPDNMNPTNPIILVEALPEVKEETTLSEKRPQITLWQSLVATIVTPISCILFYYLYHLLMHQN